MRYTKQRRYDAIATGDKVTYITTDGARATATSVTKTPFGIMVSTPEGDIKYIPMHAVVDADKPKGSARQ
jgi:hypothetical protein